MQLNWSSLWEQSYVILGSWAFFNAISEIAKYIGPYLLPSIYENASKQGKSALNKLIITWPHRIVSQLNATILCCFSVYLLARKDEFADAYDFRLRKTDPLVTRFCSISLGYFLWDTQVSLQDYSLYGAFFLLHALMALMGTVTNVAGFAQYYAARIFMFEVTALFLNAHWFMDKCCPKCSKLLIVNDVLAVSLYAIVRIYWGTKWLVFGLFRDCLVANNNNSLSGSFLALYVVIVTSGTLLNYYWFYLLMRKALSMLSTSRKINQDSKNDKGKL